MKLKIEKFGIEIDFRDPMVLILCALLVFITGGTAVAAANGVRANTYVIELDAAYGGDAAGYEGIINEAEFTEKAVEAIADALKADGHFTVKLTHEAGTSASVEEKAEKVSKDSPDFLISIHCAGLPDPTPGGMNIYPSIPTSSTNETSLKLASSIQEAFTLDFWKPKVQYLYYEPFGDDAFQIKTVDTSDTTDYQLETWSLLEKVDVPAVVVEQIYCTNDGDVGYWYTEEGLKQIGELYVKALRKMTGIDQ